MVASAQRYVPAQGDVVWLDFDPQVGHEQAGRRPAIVVSIANYNGTTGMALMCPVTNQSKGYPYEVALPADAPATGVILADQMKSVDWRARRATYMGVVGAEIVDEIFDRVANIV